MVTLDFDRLFAGWRGPTLAALFAALAALPGLLSVPPIDRDESRYAEATVQMLQTRDFVNIEYQDEPRHKKPVGIHWLQSASVAAFSSPEARQIWAYRVPSLLGAALAAAACAWGAALFFGARGAALAGAALGASMLMSTEGFFATTDAVLCGATTLSMAALGRLYGAARGLGAAGFRTRLLFWIGMALAVIVKGPIGPMVVALSLITLLVWDRQGGWMKRLGWTWGLALVLAVALPWAIAITLATHGAFWGRALGGDMASKLAGAQESHGAPPGFYLLTGIIAFFPATLVLPAALLNARRAGGGGLLRAGFAALPAGLAALAIGALLGKHPAKWTGLASGLVIALVWLGVAALPQIRTYLRTRRFDFAFTPPGDPGVGFALCWLVPAWIVFEAAPTKLPHYTLPLYGALAWLAAAALTRPLSTASRAWGVALAGLGAVLIGALALVGQVQFGAPSTWPWAVATVLFASAAVLAGGLLLLRGAGAAALLAAGVLGVAAHGVLFGGLIPALTPLWPSSSVVADLKRNGFDPRDPRAPAPVTFVGYAEASGVFQTTPKAVLGGPSAGVKAVAEGRPVVVEGAEEPAFQAGLAAAGLKATPLATERAFNYSKGRKVRLTLYRRAQEPPPARTVAPPAP